MAEPTPVTDAYAPGTNASQLVRVLDDYLAQLRQGNAPEPEVVLAAHPELADQLASCLAALDFIHRTERPPQSGAPVQLGEFRILREIGRGGMGVVYEAEQLSLKRRVALKVLRFAASPDPEALERFRREAETVARLHHTNIVPIFAVGCEQGVHFYAMQFIEGQSLDHVATPELDPLQVVHWGAQAAEALAHAHARGVIHRDIKPSNLLLDREGVVWLTDFGLARRTDEATLTATGLLLGTPRYMSPEQASSASSPVDERSDIYSLGATLYELASGKPVYDGKTPQRLMAQILEEEPIAPRHHRPELPRDLETILLMCLAKDPQGRYPEARSLAEDLRRCAAGDPIRARRPTWRERLGRWLHRHRRTVLIAGSAAAMALVATLLTVTSAGQVERWLQGQLFLATDGPALTAELVTPEGRQMGQRFTVPTEEPLAVAAGDYDLRLRGRGFLEESFKIRIERGKERAFDVSLEAQRPWTPLSVPRCYEPLPTTQGMDLLFLSDDGVTRRRGATGEILWVADLRSTADPRLKTIRWNWQTAARPSGRNTTDRRPLLVAPPVDLNGDGFPDVVFASQRQAALLALSGKDGKLLWVWEAPPGPPVPERFQDQRASLGLVIGPPCWVQSSQGPKDLAVTWAQQPAQDQPAPRHVSVLRGESGTVRWTRPLEAAWFQPPEGGSIPEDALWNHTLGISSSSHSGSHSGPHILYPKDMMVSGHGVAIPYPAVSVRWREGEALALVAGTRLLFLNPATGQDLRPPCALSLWPIRPPQYADLDGDGHSDILLLAHENNSKAVPTVPGIGMGAFPPDDDRLTLRAVSLDNGTPLWTESLRGYWAWNWYQERFDWPVLANLGKEGRMTITTPTGDFTSQGKWSGLEQRDGATGRVLWRRVITRATRFGDLLQVNRFVVGPDIDGDGIRDLFSALPDGSPWSADRPYQVIRILNMDKDYRNPDVRVDALSGADGRVLWGKTYRVRHGSLNNSPKPSVGPLTWWGPGDDGWPQLVISYTPTSPQGNPPPQETYVLSAGTGQLMRRSLDIHEPKAFDMDGDDFPELLSFHPAKGDALDQGGTLVAVRGRSPEAWRRLGGNWIPGDDYDGDGIPDLLSRSTTQERDFDPPRREAAARRKDPTDKAPIRALSSRTGRILWETEITEGKPLPNWLVSRYEVVTPAQCDLNGDGVPDLLATPSSHCMHMGDPDFSPLVAASGKTGERLWSADMRVSLWNGPQLLTCKDLDGDNRPEVLFVSASDWDWPRGPGNSRSTIDWQYWLAIFDGRTGRIRWRQSLSERNTTGANGGPAMTPFSYVFTDRDSNGNVDLILEAGLPGLQSDIRAFRGADGEPRWTWTSAPRNNPRALGRAVRPTLSEGRLGSRNVILVLHVDWIKTTKPWETPFAEIAALDAAEGKPLWTWRHEVGGEYNDSNTSSPMSRIIPRIVPLPEGGEGVLVSVGSHEDPGQVILLDATGHELHRRAIPFRLKEEERILRKSNPNVRYSPLYSPHFGARVIDVGTSGQVVVVALTEDRLVAYSADLKKELWSNPVQEEACTWLAESPVLALRQGSRTLGYDPLRGEVVWTSAGPGVPQALLNSPTSTLPPHLLVDLGDQAMACRQAVLRTGGPLKSQTPYVSSEEEDLRDTAPLPWTDLDDLPPLVPSSPWGQALLVTSLAFLIVVVPISMFIKSVRTRSMGYAVLAGIVLGLTWSTGCLAHLIYLNNDASYRVSQDGWLVFLGGVGLRLGRLAPLGLPFIAVILAGIRLTRSRAWKTLVGLTAMALLLAVGIGWLWLACTPLEEGMRWSRRGWTEIFPYGLGALGLGLTLWTISQHAIRLILKTALFKGRKIAQ